MSTKKKSKLPICQNSYVAEAGQKGRGVFALKSLVKGATVEISPYIEVPARHFNFVQKTYLERFVYDLGRNKTAVGLGHLSMYNHDKEPNATWFINRRRKVITIKITKPVKSGEEILLNYGYDPVTQEWSHN